MGAAQKPLVRSRDSAATFRMEGTSGGAVPGTQQERVLERSLLERKRVHPFLKNTTSLRQHWKEGARVINTLTPLSSFSPT